MALELPEEPLVRPPEKGQWKEGVGEPDIGMGFFLRGDETLASLEKLTKSAKATFDRGGLEVGDGDCTGEQLLDWTLAVCEAGRHLDCSWKSPWPERIAEDLAFDFVMLAEERAWDKRR